MGKRYLVTFEGSHGSVLKTVFSPSPPKRSKYRTTAKSSVEALSIMQPAPRGLLAPLVAVINTDTMDNETASNLVSAPIQKAIRSDKGKLYRAKAHQLYMKNKRFEKKLEKVETALWVNYCIQIYLFCLF